MNPIFFDGNTKFTNYWLSSDSVKHEMENRNKYPVIHETYSIMDALDGDPSAYWNIE